MSDVVLVQTGLANVASVLAGLTRAGAKVRVSASPDEVAAADFAVLPGVGAFGAGMRRLEETGLAAAVRARCEEDRPLLAICLGLQLLAEGSEESPGVVGLGVVPGVVRRLPDSVRVPQMGWNSLTIDEGCRFLSAGYVSFTNSFVLDTAPPGAAVARATHGLPFVAAFERGSLLACQFHPELSGKLGGRLLQRWLGQHGGS